MEPSSRLRAILARLRAEPGFGLVELLIAMAVLSIGLFALLGTFTNGYRILTRASSKGAASVLADKTMETYRGMSYSAIPCTGSPPTVCSFPPTNALGPDGRTYTVTTKIELVTATDTDPDLTDPHACQGDPTDPLWHSPCRRTVKFIVVTVADSTGRQLASQRSTFDPLTGQLTST